MMSFNPITNQPLADYKSQQEQRELIMNQQMRLYNDEKMKRPVNLREQNPIEYNPYKQPNSIYQGHP